MTADFTIEEIRSMDRDALALTAERLRQFLIEKVSENGGHLSSNLGTVELTLALVRAFDVPNDKIIFDVGHQSYAYKAITGRADRFDTLRKLNGLSGFPKRSESEFDVMDTGHSSTSVSAAVGLAKARDLRHESYEVVSVIGDGSMTGGEAFEGLNNASTLDSKLIIILNDNGMSISRNVGGLTKALTTIRSGSGYNKVKLDVRNILGESRVGEALKAAVVNAKDSVKELVMPTGMFFENLGLKYLGPVDGHDVIEMETVFKRAKEMNRPVLIHVLTEKGKGYALAEKHPSYFHGIGPFDVVSGKEKCVPSGKTYSDIFGEFMDESADDFPEITAVTAAMRTGTGLKQFRKNHPERFFDVGIAEQHAVTFSAGLALGGMHPYFAVYSSFLQRAYDQIIEDVALQNLSVVFAIDRAGITGQDGETHQGVFDLSFLAAVPNMTVLAPRSGNECRKMLEFTRGFEGPVAIRYPKGVAAVAKDVPEIEFGKAETVLSGAGCLILSVGTMTETAIEVAELLKPYGIRPTILNMRFVKPWDKETVLKLLPSHAFIVTMEDNVLSGGFGESVAAFVSENDAVTKVISVGVPDAFVPQGKIGELKKQCGMDARTVARRIREQMEQL